MGGLGPVGGGWGRELGGAHNLGWNLCTPFVGCIETHGHALPVTTQEEHREKEPERDWYPLIGFQPAFCGQIPSRFGGGGGDATRPFSAQFKGIGWMETQLMLLHFCARKRLALISGFATPFQNRDKTTEQQLHISLPQETDRKERHIMGKAVSPGESPRGVW